MKYISIIEQPSREAVRAFAEKRNLTEYLEESYEHPQEDYLVSSENPPVFVVADGVTLDFKKFIETKEKYPNPSPAGEVAKIFCKAVQESAQSKYVNLSKEDTKEIFKEANSAVAEYNNKIGKSDISGNITGFYAATGAFMVIKDDKGYWVSICDAFFAHFDKDMNPKFISSGLCSPYAVINGEDKMSDHIESGIINIKKGDRIFVFTDGFEHYFKNQEFLDLFKNWSDDLQQRIREFSRKKNVENPEQYGHERSLIAINKVL